MTSSEFPLRCQCRRHAVTSLRCARCSVPICPDCSVIAPAGMLCQSCANGKVGQRFELERTKAAPIVLATLLAGIVLGWMLVGVFGGFGFFGFLADYFYGVTIAEVALRISGRKRGKAMEIIGTSCAVIGVVAGHILMLGRTGIPIPAILFSLLMQPMFYIQAGIAGYAAFSRLRYL